MPVEEADALYETLRKSGAEVDKFFFNLLIHKHVRANNTARGLFLFDAMRRAGVAPNHVTFAMFVWPNPPPLFALWISDSKQLSLVWLNYT